jgi:hypothetical protein
MNRRSIFLILALLMITHRLPAPIVETPEKATPAPEQSAKPKPKRVTRQKIESESSQEKAGQQIRTASPSPTPNQNPFEGVWVGTLNNLPFTGNVEFTLVVTAAGTAVTEKSANFGSNSFQANCDGSTMRWETGSSWSLTPNPDRQTALVTCNNGGFFGVGAFSLSTVFRKSGTPSATITQTTAANTQQKMPVARPVPNKPGFVYNPFDSTANRLLDVRGKPSGAKVKDPVSGKLFIVP